ncbi:hypothetical protein [Pseudomonas sp.]|uniref:hypothetical protein n=1 Tax=Pseudomonas sp. TaxID=306 RepID=UPI002E38187C|nr:hypothetical protein [Pseudomonas sp.]HEX4549569.1 hypothetical protein [Pseudomonas sp.]
MRVDPLQKHSANYQTDKTSFFHLAFSTTCESATQKYEKPITALNEEGTSHMQSAQNPVPESADARQKERVVKAIKEHLHWTDWDGLAIDIVAGSSIDQFNHAPRQMLARLVRQAEFQAHRHNHFLPDDIPFRVNEAGRVECPPHELLNNLFHDVTDEISGTADYKEQLRLLANAAKTNGGFVRSDGMYSVGQWLRVHGLDLPGNQAEAQYLVELLHFLTLPEGPADGNYWQLLGAPPDSPYQLTAQRRALIQQTTTEHFTAGDSLVAMVGGHLILESSSADNLPTRQGYRLQRLLAVAQWSLQNGQPYLQALQWFSDETGPQPTPAFVRQLLVAVLLLDLDPDVEINSLTFAGFDLYSRNYLLAHPSRVRIDLENHLVDKLGIARLLAPLICEWVLAGMAPEFLCNDWPSTLKMGTPAWVIATQAVQRVEALIPGASREITYQHLLGFSQATGKVTGLKALHAGNIDPVLKWAVMNSLVTRNDDGSLTPADVTLATRQYNDYIEMMLKASELMRQPIPQRKSIALQELKARVPDCDPQELLVLVRGTGGGGGRKISVVDLYMGDELHTQNWDRPRGRSIYAQHPALSRLYPATQLHEEAVHAHHAGLVTALISNIEVALSQVDPGFSAHLEDGVLGIYRVEPYTTTNFPTLPTPGGITRPQTPVPGEAGRFGVIICARRGSSTRCFELFPLRMECRVNLDLERTFSALVSVDADAQVTFADQRKHFEEVALDARAYLSNVEPREGIRSRVFIRKIGELRDSARPDPETWPNPYFRSPRKRALSERVAENVPYLTLEDVRRMGFDQTQREKAIATTEEVFRTIINIIVPFKACVEEMSSGDPKRQYNAVLGCVMDAAALGLAFAVIPGKIAAITSSAAQLVPRLLSVSRVLGGAAISVLNPLNGLPQLLKGGVKMVGGGVRAARNQLRHLTGADSYDLLRAIDHTGEASRIRLSLDTVAHARAVFKSDAIEGPEQILKYLHANDPKVLKNVPEQELTRLLEDALIDGALKSGSSQSLKKLLDPAVVETLVRQQATKYSLANLHQFDDPALLPSLFDSTLQIEYRNLTAMQAHQQSVLLKNLDEAPFNGIADELKFNPNGFQDPVDRATAWIFKASSSRNERGTIKELLLEYAANGKVLNDPAVYSQLHRALVPDVVDHLRSPTAQARYPSNVSGAAALQKHVASLDPLHEYFGKQMLGAMLGYHSYVDGNGRTARAVYAITELRKGRFIAPSVSAENALSGLG